MVAGTRRTRRDGVVLLTWLQFRAYAKLTEDYRSQEAERSWMAMLKDPGTYRERIPGVEGAEGYLFAVRKPTDILQDELSAF